MNTGLDTSRIESATPLSVISTNWPLLLGMGVLMLGAGLQSTLLGLRATLEGFPTLVTGLVLSCYYVGYVMGTKIAPPLLRKLGHIRVFAALAAIAAAAVLVQGCFVDPWSWGAMRLVQGLCFAGLYVVAESWLNDRATRENRGRLFAVYMLVLYVGLGSAQFLLVLADPRTPIPFMLVAVLISLAMVPIVVSAQRVPEHAVPRKVRLRDLYRNSPLGIVSVTISGLISAIIFSMGPVYARLSAIHGGEHSRRRYHSVPCRAPLRPSGSAHGDRRGVYSCHAGLGQHRRIPADAARSFPGARGAVQRIRLDALLAIRLACERQTRARANGRGQQCAAAVERRGGGLRTRACRQFDDRVWASSLFRHAGDAQRHAGGLRFMA
jgi:hypothetical protein